MDEEKEVQGKDLNFSQALVALKGGKRISGLGSKLA